MSSCFADSSYYFALFNPRDDAHAIASSITKTLRRPIVTTSWVLTEIGDGLATTNSRRLFSPFIARLQSIPSMTIVPAEESLFQKAVRLYESRLDKTWSVTDCVSFLVMRHYAISDALTTDHHFAQAGFTVLLK